MILPALLLRPFARMAAIAGAGALVLGGYTYVIDHSAYARGKSKAETKFVTRYVQAQAKETVRRETVVEKVQVRAANDVKRIKAQAVQISKLKGEVQRASAANDAVACLGPPSVRRLAAIHLD